MHGFLNPPLRGTALGVLLASVVCSSPGSTEPVAVPSFELNMTHVPIGSPIEATFTFFVLPNAVIDEDYRVFLHFLSDDGELIWAADHDPPRPTTEWKPGGTIEYTRTILVPPCSYRGDTDVSMGLYSMEDGTRLPLEADHAGQLAYHVGQLSLLPSTKHVRLLYRSGWHALEGDATCVRWRWSEKVGVIVFDNPQQDSRLYLNLDSGEDWDDQPRTLTVTVGDRLAARWRWSEKVGVIVFDNPQQDSRLYLNLDSGEDWDDQPRTLTVTVGDRLAARFEIVPGNVVHEIPLSASLFGGSNEVELRLEVDRTFVPADLPHSDNLDARVLGVRVLGAYLVGETREQRGQL